MRSGTLFQNEEVRELLMQNDLASIDRIFQHVGEAHNRHTGRSVWDTNLNSGNDSQEHVYIKMNWGRRRLWPRMTDLKTGQWLQSLPEREWHGIGTLGQLGLNVPDRLALFHQGQIRFRSAVIVRAIPPALSLFNLLENGEWVQLASADREQILLDMTRVMRTIHAAGLGWRGTSIGHFYPQKKADGEWTTWVIDCEGVHNRATQKTFKRDDKKLIRSFELAGADDWTRATLVNLLQQGIPAGKTRAA